MTQRGETVAKHIDPLRLGDEQLDRLAYVVCEHVALVGVRVRLNILEVVSKLAVHGTLPYEDGQVMSIKVFE